MANVFDPDFDSERDRPGFTSRRAMLGRQAGSERLGVSLFELAPEQAPFPLHYHLGNEELLIVLRGTPTLRTLEGERELAEGEVVAFPLGERGAHQIVNRTDQAGQDPDRQRDGRSGHRRPARVRKAERLRSPTGRSRRWDAQGVLRARRG